MGLKAVGICGIAAYRSPHVKAAIMNVPPAELAQQKASEIAGLTSTDAASQRVKFGPNDIVEEQAHPLMRLARHFWAPVPWMLEATIALQIILGQRLTASMIATLLVPNVLLATFQESRANSAWHF